MPNIKPISDLRNYTSVVTMAAVYILPRMVMVRLR